MTRQRPLRWPFDWIALVIAANVCMIVVFLDDPRLDRPMTWQAWGIAAVAFMAAVVAVVELARIHRHLRRQRRNR